MSRGRGEAAGTVARGDARGDATRCAAAGVDSPRLDAELLLAEATGRTARRLAADPDGRRRAPPPARAFGAMVRRRVAREPVAYILGRRGFRRPRAALRRPRPDPAAGDRAAGRGRARARARARSSTSAPGSGAVALAIADELPGRRVVAVDTSRRGARPGAARTPRRSGSPSGSSSARSVAAGAAATFDLVVANLPYVRDADWRVAGSPRSREYEPREALFAGADGLDAIRGLLAALARGGAGAAGCDAVALEIGEGQARDGGRARRGGRLRPGRGAPRPRRHRAGRDRRADERASSRSSATGAAAARAALERCILGGGVALFPADGLYGLACDPLRADAIARIHEIKGRDDGKPSAVMYFSPLVDARAGRLDWASAAGRRSGALLPGPVTLVLANPEHRYPLACREDPERLGVRLIGGPLAGAHCVRSSRPAPTAAASRRRPASTTSSRRSSPRSIWRSTAAS